jgi:hypothetical protein
VGQRKRGFRRFLRLGSTIGPKIELGLPLAHHGELLLYQALERMCLALFPEAVGGSQSVRSKQIAQPYSSPSFSTDGYPLFRKQFTQPSEAEWTWKDMAFQTLPEPW